MTVEMLSPGLYPTEVDFSQFVRSVSTSTFGLVGVFEKGPINTPILVTSLADAESQLGSYLSGGHFGLFALKNFFENGGSRAYVVRVCAYSGETATAITSTVTLVDRAGSPLATLRVDAASPGTWGNSLRVQIAASTAYPTTGFNLVVKTAAGVVLETHKDLLLGTANVASDDYVEKRINTLSSLIRVSDLLSVTAANSNLPALVSLAALASGTDGLSGLAITDYTGNQGNARGLYALDTVDVNFVAVPGESDAVSGATLAGALVTYAELRKDCIAIVEVPQGSTATTAVDFRRGTGSYAHAAFNSSYGALYGPWQKATHPVTGAAITLPPSGFVAGIYARNDATSGVANAPAGLKRGVLRGATAPERVFSQAERDVLSPAQVNSITLIAGSLVIWGNQTLQLRASLLSSVHVRRLMAFVEKSVKDAGQFMVFDQNNKKTWEAFKRLVNPFLSRLKDDGAFSDYLVVCDETTNTPASLSANPSLMVVKVYVKPVGAAEFISVEFAIAPAAAEFSAL